MELSGETYGEIMEKLGSIQSDVSSIKDDVALVKGDHEKRLRILEQKPGKWLDKLLSAGVGAAIGGFIAKIIK